MIQRKEKTIYKIRVVYRDLLHRLHKQQRKQERDRKSSNWTRSQSEARVRLPALFFKPYAQLL